MIECDRLILGYVYSKSFAESQHISISNVLYSKLNRFVALKKKLHNDVWKLFHHAGNTNRYSVKWRNLLLHCVQTKQQFPLKFIWKRACECACISVCVLTVRRLIYERHREREQEEEAEYGCFERIHAQHDNIAEQSSKLIELTFKQSVVFSYIISFVCIDGFFYTISLFISIHIKFIRSVLLFWIFSCIFSFSRCIVCLVCILIKWQLIQCFPLSDGHLNGKQWNECICAIA